MNKAFKKYNKTRWLNTRLSKKYKARLAVSKMKVASIVAQSIAHIDLIRCSGGSKVSKGLAIATAVTSTYKAISDALLANKNNCIVQKQTNKDL